MKIVLIHHLSDLYGASRSLARLAGGLLRGGHEVCCVVQEDGPLCAVLREAGVRVEILPSLPVLHRNRLRSVRGLCNLLRDAIRARRALRVLMAAVRPDVVHTNTAVILPVAGAAARALGIPHIQHVRETFEDFGPLWPPYRAWLLRRATRVVCISAHLARLFPEPARGRKVRVLHNGLPREEFDGIDAADVEAFVSRFSLRRPLVGLVGRIKLRRKGQDTFVRAAALLRERCPDACFVIVGAPFPGNESHVAELRRTIDQLGLADRVVLTGHIPDTRIPLAALDVSVMASGTPEPLGNVTIESMALGKAVVGTAIGGTTELIDDGRTGLLVPPNDPRAMADALETLLKDPARRQRLGEAARRHFLEHLEFDAFRGNIEALYREVLR